jgi:hypothetical protein
LVKVIPVLKSNNPFSFIVNPLITDLILPYIVPPLTSVLFAVPPYDTVKVPSLIIVSLEYKISAITFANYISI